MTNPHIDRVVTAYEDRHAHSDLSVSHYSWASNYLRYEDKPFNTAGYPFQRDILNDDHPHQVCRKLSQVGLTTIYLIKMRTWMQRLAPINGFLTFPDKDMRDRNSQVRILPFFEDNDKKRPQGMSQVRNQKVIQLRRSTLYVTHLTPGAATSTPADFIVHDERDQSSTEIIKAFRSRLQNSSFHRIVELGTPTFTDFGVDRDYQTTDQRVWMQKCPRCNHWQELDFCGANIIHPDVDLPEDILTLPTKALSGVDLTKAVLVCSACREPFDRTEAEHQWVARRPDVTAKRGWQLRPFCSYHHEPAYFLGRFQDDYDDPDPRVRPWFINTALGRAHSDGNFRLEENMIREVMRPPESIPTDRPLWLGADRGGTCWITLCDQYGRFVYFESCVETEFYSRIMYLYNTYPNIVCGAIDRLPSASEPAKIHTATEGKINPVHWVKTGADIHRNRNSSGQSIDDYYHVHRTNALDRVRLGVKDQHILICCHEHQERELIDHLRAVAREIDIDGNEKYRKLSDDNHWYFAMAYALTAMRISEYDAEHATESNNSVVLVSAVTKRKLRSRDRLV